tara:strand:- start:9816 stop:9989 length:174 start_codon:yes stop_codon:yes gene_type:complete
VKFYQSVENWFRKIITKDNTSTVIIIFFAGFASENSFFGTRILLWDANPVTPGSLQI